MQRGASSYFLADLCLQKTKKHNTKAPAKLGPSRCKPQAECVRAVGLMLRPGPNKINIYVGTTLTQSSSQGVAMRTVLTSSNAGKKYLR